MYKSYFKELEKTRKVKISLEPVSGSITMFYGFLNGVKIIQGDGTKKRAWNGDIPLNQCEIKIRVTGIDNASFKTKIDLEDIVDDQEITFKLINGYYETEIKI